MPRRLYLTRARCQNVAPVGLRASCAPSYAEERLVRAGAAAPDHGAEGFLCPECRFRASSPEALTDHYARAHPA